MNLLADDFFVTTVNYLTEKGFTSTEARQIAFTLTTEFNTILYDSPELQKRVNDKITN